MCETDPDTQWCEGEQTDCVLSRPRRTCLTKSCRQQQWKSLGDCLARISPSLCLQRSPSGEPTPMQKVCHMLWPNDSGLRTRLDRTWEFRTLPHLFCLANLAISLCLFHQDSGMVCMTSEMDFENSWMRFATTPHTRLIVLTSLLLDGILMNTIGLVVLCCVVTYIP